MEKMYKTQTRFLFRAHIKVKLPAGCPDSLFDELFGIAASIDRHYNSYTPGSYTDRINRAAGRFTEVDETTITILQEVIRLSDMCQGLFDMTIMPLLRLWGFYSMTGKRVPSPDEIRQIIREVDYHRIEIEDNRVRIGSGQEITTGGFLKAWATDRMAEDILQRGIEDVIINAGGSTICCLNNPAQPHWKVMVNLPGDITPTLILPFSNECYTTSVGDTIVHPQLGTLSTNQQVGLLTDHCLEGDIFSTALMNETPEGFRILAASITRKMALSGFLVDKEGKVTATDGFENRIKDFIAAYDAHTIA